jgi:hypothetical protein
VSPRTRQLSHHDFVTVIATNLLEVSRLEVGGQFSRLKKLRVILTTSGRKNPEDLSASSIFQVLPAIFESLARSLGQNGAPWNESFGRAWRVFAARASPGFFLPLVVRMTLVLRAKTRNPTETLRIFRSQ